MDTRTGLIALCPASAVRDGSGLQVIVDDLVVAIFKIGDRFYVVDDACTHGPGQMSEGEQDGDVIECNFHGGQFNIRTGEVVGPPCTIPIRTYHTEIIDGHVYIDRDRAAQP